MTAPFTDPNVSKAIDRLTAMLGQFLSPVLSISRSLATIANSFVPAPGDVSFTINQPKETTMKRQKINLTCRLPKAGKKSAVVNPVTITGPCDITVQFLDDTGAPIPGILASNVTSTLTSDNPAVTFTETDALDYTGQIAAGTTTGTANVTLTANVTNPAAGPFTATCVVTLNIPPVSPPVPVDVTFTVTPTP